MRAIKRNSGLWAYLSKLEGFENFSEEEIQAHKKAYWRLYDQKRQASKRKQKREIVIIFPASDIKVIRATAKAKGYSLHAYVRECIKADISKLTVIPHLSQVSEIMQVLRQCRNQLDAIKQKDVKGWVIISRTYENVETVLNENELRITSILKKPQSLKQIIIDSININPDTIHLLQTILESYGNNQVNDS
jgi:predicted DNA binding CopG/RHH family protein